MPSLQSSASTIRADQYTYTGYLVAVPRTVIVSRAVNQASFTYPLTSITFDNAYSGAGAYTDIIAGMTVLVYNGNTSTLKGMCRVAYGGASSTVLQVNEMGQGVIDWADNDRIDICIEFGCWDILVGATSTLPKDSRRAYVNENSIVPPYSNSGGPYAGFVDSTGYFTRTLYGDTSFTVDPDSAGTVTHLWSAPGAVAPITSTSANPTFSFPARRTPYLVSHRVTDTSNSATATQYLMVWACDPVTAPPMAVRMSGLQGSDTDGWTATFELPVAAEADISNLPDGVFVVYFEVEHYDSVEGSYGSNVTGQSTVKFAGYIDSESITITPDDSSVEFTAVNVLALLEKTAALPQLLVNTTSPTTWQQVRTLKVWFALDYYLGYGSTAPLFHDFIWSDGTNKAYSRLAVQNQDSIAGQLRDLADGLLTKVTCDRLSRLLLIRDANYLTASERNSRTTAYDLTSADWVQIHIPRTYRRTVKFVRGEGIVASNTEALQVPIFSNAPGNAPGSGTSSETLARQIDTNQAELNRNTGDHYARLNGLYYNESTKAITQVPQGVEITLPASYDIFDPAYQDYITLTLPASTNKRGISFTTSDRWLITQAAVSYNPDTLTKEVTLTVDHETHGPSGVTYVPPQSSQTGVTPPPSGDLTNPGGGTYTPPVPTPGGWLAGADTLAAVTSFGIWKTTNFNTPASAGGPTWTKIYTTGGGVTWRAFVVDGASPKYLGTGTTVNGWAFDINHVYRILDILGTPTVSTQLTNLTGYDGLGADFSYGAGGAGLFGVFAGVLTAGATTRYNLTTDGGVTWSALAGITASTGGTVETTAGCFISSNSGYAYATGYNGATYDLYRSNGGAWAAYLSVAAIRPLDAICIPFFNNASDQYLYFGKKIDATSTGELLIRYDGVTQTDISPVIGGSKCTPSRVGDGGRWRMSIPSNSDNKMLLMAQQANTSNTGVVLTNNLKDTSPTWVPLITPVPSQTYIRGLLADDGQSCYLFGGTGGNVSIAFTGNGFDGTTPDNRTGNMTGDSSILGIAGG